MLKGAVPKPATQKILFALAEKGDVTQKTYGMYAHISRDILPHVCTGKATLFVANQNKLDALPEKMIKALADETDSLLESNKTLAAEIKVASAGDLGNSDSRLVSETANTCGRVGEYEDCADGC